MSTATALPKLTLSDGAVDFIDDARLTDLVNVSRPDAAAVRDVIARSMEKQPLSVEQTAVLLAADQPELVEEIFEAARELKRRVYGNRIVLFAPLYVGNQCVNDCGYCAFRRSNDQAIRHTLSMEDVRRQVKALEDVGHKRLILVWGEHPSYGAATIAQTIRAVWSGSSNSSSDAQCIST